VVKLGGHVDVADEDTKRRMKRSKLLDLGAMQRIEVESLDFDRCSERSVGRRTARLSRLSSYLAEDERLQPRRPNESWPPRRVFDLAYSGENRDAQQILSV
jgi:hypothetical protein